MRVPASAYEVLGLAPGADRQAVEDAYRRLIKLHHPDRSGGDAGRAAEINRAYFELRRQHESTDPEPPVGVRPPSRARAMPRKRRRRSRLWPLVILALAVLLLFERESIIEQAPRWTAWLADLRPSAPAPGRGSPAQVDSTALDGPLNATAISSSIAQAARLARSGDEEQLAQHSRACHRELRRNPGLAQLDRCAAFDDAVVALADRGPLTDSGAFNASAVTARQMTAARLLSSDYLAIERRLDRIRMMVELALMPRAPLPPPPDAVEDPQLAPEPIDSEVVPNGA